MKVALICPADFTVVLCCRWIIKHLRDKGIEVLVLSPLGIDNFYLNKIKDFNVKHIEVKMNRHINFIDDIKYLFELFLVFRKYKIDSTFSVCTKPNIYSPLASKLAGINNIYTSVWGRGTDFLRRKTEKFTCQINFNLPLQIIFFTF